MATEQSIPRDAGYRRAARAALLAMLALAAGAAAQKSPDTLLLKDYRPLKGLPSGTRP